MNRNIAFSALLAVVILAVISLGSLNAEENKKFVVIANPSVQSAALSTNELKALFLGDSDKLSTGEKIVVFIQKSGQSHDSFVKDCVGKSSKKFSAYWKEQIFTGAKIEPKSFSSEDDLVKAVSQTAGAISYVSPDKVAEGVKVLAVSNL